MQNAQLNLFKSFCGELDPVQLQRKFLMALLELQNVGRGSIWIKQNDAYRCIEAAGDESDRVKGVAISAGVPSIVGWVIENARMTVADPATDQRHFKDLEEKLALKSRLILCFPLFHRDQQVYGAVQIIDTSPETSRINRSQRYLKGIQDLVNIGSMALGNTLFVHEKLRETETLRETLAEIRQKGRIVGQSPAFMAVMEKVRSYATTDFPVLITGESGTGKELIARKLHRAGPRQSKPFLTQNCSAIPETLLESELFGYKKGAFTGAARDKVGLFAAAHGGSVFLDEIGDMPLNLQARILRVLQNGEIKPLGDTGTRQVDIRIIAATHRNMPAMVADGQFRQDLFYRLSVLPLHLPALRERHSDIPLLINHFLKKEALKMDGGLRSIDPAAMQLLCAYPWQGNIRELENLVRYLLVVAPGPDITSADLPAHIAPDASQGDPQSSPGTLPSPDSGQPLRRRDDFFAHKSWEEVEKEYAHYLLAKNNGNLSRAARDARVNRSTFVSRLLRLGIKGGRKNSELK